MKSVHLLSLSIILSFSLPSSSLTNTITFPISFAHSPQTTATRTRLPLVLVRIGTPPKTLRLLPDTGSDITWFFCDADSHDSDTLSVMYANDFDDTVLDYMVNYPDGSRATGDWVTETVTATSHDGSDVTMERVRIGCTDRSLSRIKSPIDGVLSLSRDSLSFATQVAERFGDRFSYALREGGQLVIGARDARASHYYTQLSDSNSSSSYEAKASSLSMGDTVSGVMKEIWDLHSEVVFRSGATTTYFPRSAFAEIALFLADYFGDDVYFEVTEDKICFDPYYNSTSSSDEEEELEEVEGIRLPHLSIELEGRAIFIPMLDRLYYVNEEALLCVNFQPVDDDQPFLIGSSFQEGFTWDYDLSHNELGFTPELD